MSLRITGALVVGCILLAAGNAPPSYTHGAIVSGVGCLLMIDAARNTIPEVMRIWEEGKSALLGLTGREADREDPRERRWGISDTGLRASAWLAFGAGTLAHLAGFSTRTILELAILTGVVAIAKLAKRSPVPAAPAPVAAPPPAAPRTAPAAPAAAAGASGMRRPDRLDALLADLRGDRRPQFGDRANWNLEPARAELAEDDGSGVGGSSSAARTDLVRRRGEH